MAHDYQQSDQVRPEVAEAMAEVASYLKDKLPPSIGFGVFMFDYGPTGFMSWVSSAEREDMIDSLKELLALLENRIHPGPVRPQ